MAQIFWGDLWGGEGCGVVWCGCGLVRSSLFCFSHTYIYCSTYVCMYRGACPRRLCMSRHLFFVVYLLCVVGGGEVVDILFGASVD